MTYFAIGILLGLFLTAVGLAFRGKKKEEKPIEEKQPETTERLNDWPVYKIEKVTLDRESISSDNLNPKQKSQIDKTLVELEKVVAELKNKGEKQ